MSATILVVEPNPATRALVRRTLTEWQREAKYDGLHVAHNSRLLAMSINIANAGTLPEAKPGEAVYVGVKACLECHDEVESFWKHDRHAEAWATLEKDKKTFDAECVSCHVTGYGRAGGSLVGHTEGRENVQCEACHGPGSKHAEDGDPDLIVREPTVEVCVGCHNSHHSPTFDFAVYKPKLMVPGHGKPVD